MTVYFDADVCPVIRSAESIAKRDEIPAVLLCDTNHALTSDYSAVKVIGAGAYVVLFLMTTSAWFIRIFCLAGNTVNLRTV